MQQVDSFQKIFPIVGWFLVVLGWLVASRQNSEREKRKELRDALNNLKKIAEELRRKAFEFHLSSDFSEDVALQILHEIQVLSSEVRYLEFIHSTQSNLLKAVRQSITLHNFDKTSFTRRDPSSEQLRLIRDSIYELNDALESEFSHRYRRNIIQKIKISKRRAQ